MRFLTIVLTSTVIIFSQVSTAQKATTTSSMKKESFAAEDTFHVIICPVKADKRQQYEQFINEAFWPSSAKMSAAERSDFLKYCQVLYPTAPDSSGTYTYLFIVEDPKSKSADRKGGLNLSLYDLLLKAHGKEKTEYYLKMFMESLAGSQTYYKTVRKPFQASGMK